jgi:hypothetical protein
MGFASGLMGSVCRALAGLFLFGGVDQFARKAFNKIDLPEIVHQGFV